MADGLSLERLLIVAPHPDDEAIAAAGLIQRSVAGGGTVLTLCLTDGENNPWPQRAILRRWRITDDDRREWGATRRRETVDGLAHLGGGNASARFFAFPDGSLGDLARAGDAALDAHLHAAIDEFRPTLVVSPSSYDVHPDHCAAAWFVHRAVNWRVPIATYAVHSAAPAARVLVVLSLDETERRRKREAIASHHSQVFLSRKRFLRYASATETYYVPEYDVVRVPSKAGEALAVLRHMAHVLRP